MKLYDEKKLSTYKIASMLGVNNKTVYYWLVKYSIPRREGPIEARCRINKLLTKRVLADLYVNERLSLKETGETLGVSPESVRKYLMKHGIKRRLGEFQPIYLKTPFAGKTEDACYMLGLRIGDLTVHRRSSKRVRVFVSTTHPAMIELMYRLFERYGRVNAVPRKPPRAPRERFSSANSYAWEVYADVDHSFGFLLEKPDRVPREILNDEKRLLAFLAGYVDAEGYIRISNKPGRKCIGFTLRIKTKEKGILQDLSIGLEYLGYHPGLYNLSDGFYELSVNRKNEFFDLLGKLKVKHDEKVGAKELAFRIRDRKWHEVESLVKAFRRKIKDERLGCINNAESEWKSKHRL